MRCARAIVNARGTANPSTSIHSDINIGVGRGLRPGLILRVWGGGGGEGGGAVIKQADEKKPGGALRRAVARSRCARPRQAAKARGGLRGHLYHHQFPASFGRLFGTCRYIKPDAGGDYRASERREAPVGGRGTAAIASTADGRLSTLGYDHRVLGAPWPPSYVDREEGAREHGF